MNLENSFGGEKAGIKVLDRTALILDIFAQHAKTKEGKLQVRVVREFLFASGRVRVQEARRLMALSCVIPPKYDIH